MHLNLHMWMASSVVRWLWDLAHLCSSIWVSVSVLKSLTCFFIYRQPNVVKYPEMGVIRNNILTQGTALSRCNVEPCHRQAHSKNTYGFRVAKVEWGCEAREFKEFFCMLTSKKTKPTVGLWKYGWATSFSSLLHSPQLYRLNLYFYNRALQHNSQDHRNPDIVRCFMTLAGPLWRGKMSLLHCTAKRQVQKTI